MRFWVRRFLGGPIPGYWFWNPVLRAIPTSFPSLLVPELLSLGSHATSNCGEEKDIKEL